MKTTPSQKILLHNLQTGFIQSQNTQNLLFKILNNPGNDELKENIQEYFTDYEFEGFKLSDEQVLKGFDWLKNLWVTPAGKERKNNPFGYREQEALKNFDRIELKGYYDAGNYYRSYFIPMYDVYTKDGYGFEYFVNGGQIHITG